MTEPAARVRLRNNLPGAYRGEVHAVLHFGLLSSASLLGVAALWAQQPVALFGVAALLPCWALLEYAVHRFVLHGAALRSLSRDHGLHHACFPHDNLFLDSPRDWYRILSRPQDVLALEAIAGVATLGAWLLSGLPGALVVFTSANAYFLAYELVHTAAHIERLAAHPLLRWFTTSHIAHHGGESQANFAVVVPAIDRLFGTALPQK